MAQIAEMVVALQVDLGRTKERLKQFENRTERTFKKTSRAAKSASGGFSALAGSAKRLIGVLAGAATVGGIARFVNQVASAQAQVGLLSDKLGLSTEFLSELRLAAKKSGVEFNSLTTGFQRAIRRLEEFRATGKGVAAPALEALGLSERVREGARFEDIIDELADGFRNMSSEAERVRTAFALFDTEGVNLVNLLSQGSEAIERMRESARDLGLSLSKEQTDNGRQFTDSLEELKDAATGLGNELPIGKMARFLKILTSAAKFARSGKGTFGGIRIGEDGTLRLAPGAPTVQPRTPSPTAGTEFLAQIFGVRERALREMQSARNRQNLGPPIPPIMARNSANVPTELQATPTLGAFGRTLVEGLSMGADAARQSLTPALTSVRDAVGEVATGFGELGNAIVHPISTAQDTWSSFIETFTPTAQDAIFALGSIVQTVSAGIGQLAAEALFEAGLTAEALKETLKALGKQVVATLVRLAAEYLIFTAIAKILNIGLAKQEVSTQTGIAAAAASAASIKSFGLLGIALAPGFAKAATAVTVAAAQAGFAAGGAQQPPKFARGGIFDGPRSGGLAVLHGREAVVPLDGPYANRGGMVAVVEIDGREIGRAVFNHGPRALRSGGLR